MKIKIYCLYDPAECKVRYVGRTSKKVLNHRLIEHISKSRYFERYYEGKRIPYRVNWIKKLLNEGREPKIKLLCEIEGWKESHISERCLIKKWKKVRDLVNLEDRGEGDINRNVPKEDRIKISNTLKEYYKTHVNPRSKTLYCYDLTGKFIESFESARKCSIQYKIPDNKINDVCTKRISRYKSWMFSYEYHENISPFVKLPHKYNITSSIKRRIVFEVENLITREVFIFYGHEEVGNFLGIGRTSVIYYIKKYKGIYNKLFKITVQSKLDELLEPLQNLGNQQPSLGSEEKYQEGSTTNE